MHSPLESLARRRKGRTKRISSYERNGGNADRIQIAPGETVTIAKIEGAGAIRHIWFTIAHTDPMFRRNMVLRMYWDGCETPSVECPVGDFFGQGWGDIYNYASLPMAAGPRGGRGLNCYFPMPFADGAEITIENDSEIECRCFYYYVDYEEHDEPDVDEFRFHAFWSRSCDPPAENVENEHANFYPFNPNLTDKRNHLMIDAKGEGHYVGVNYFVHSPSPKWYGEGDDMFFIDGEPWPPSLHGTGTEDYFNASWCPKDAYLHPYFGYPVVAEGESGHLGKTHCYRYHIEDPIIFKKSLRGSIERGHGNCLPLDIVTVAYWYQSLPHKPFPALPDRAGRQNMPDVTHKNIQMWREAWRQTMGGGRLWGHEEFPKSFRDKMKRQGKKTANRQATAKARKAAEQEVAKQEEMLNRRKR